MHVRTTHQWSVLQFFVSYTTFIFFLGVWMNITNGVDVVFFFYVGMWENNRDVDNQVQTLLSSHFRRLEIFLGVWKRLQAEGAHAETPE